jgi:hypothetical protein
LDHWHHLIYTRKFLSAILFLSRSEQKTKKLIKSRKPEKKIIEKTEPKKPIKFLKKPADSVRFRFYNQKNEPIPKNTRKKPSQNRENQATPI